DELSLKEPIIYSKPVSDEEPLLLSEGSNNSAQNKVPKSSQQNVIVSKRKTNNLQNNNTNKKPKPGKSLIGSDDNLNQCTHTFEITTSTTNLADHLRTVHRLNKTGPLLPLSGEKELQQDLTKDKKRGVRNNAKTLEKLLLTNNDLLEIQKLVELLGPFAHVTTIVGSDHYPTLSMMLPLLSFGEYWEEPGPEGYVAAMLDPRFKNISFELAKFELTKDKLICRMKEDIKNNTYSLPNTNLSTSLLSPLFEETNPNHVLLKLN
ncbi:26147_t:CDS:2, partial [Gigaspora rosea]